MLSEPPERRGALDYVNTLTPQTLSTSLRSVSLWQHHTIPAARFSSHLARIPGAVVRPECYGSSFLLSPSAGSPRSAVLAMPKTSLTPIPCEGVPCSGYHKNLD